jgi:II/X family phage/plasmid replication protein
MMVDWLTVEIPCRLPGPIMGGYVAKWKEDGEIEWQTMSRKVLEGSWSSKINVRAVSPELLEISGNVAKFLQGHNLFGPSDPGVLLRRFLEVVQPVLWPDGMPEFDIDAGSISRIDVTDGLLLDRPADVLSFLKAAEERGNCPYRGRGVFKGEGTLVYGDATGKRAKAWQLTLYSKGLEVAKRPLPEPMLTFPGVLDWVNRLLRVEVRLRTAELKRMARRRVGDWAPVEGQGCAATAAWSEKVGRIAFMEGTVMEGNEMVGVKPRLVMAYRAWAAGDDLRQALTKASFYRLRRELLDQFGVDISIKAPRSNIVPLRRVITAEPAHRPPWADAVENLLARRRAA